MTPATRLTGTRYTTETTPAALLNHGQTVVLALPDGVTDDNLTDALNEGRVLIEHERITHPDRFYLDHFDTAIRWAGTVDNASDHGTHVDITVTVYLPAAPDGTGPRFCERTFTVLPYDEVDVVTSPATPGR